MTALEKLRDTIGAQAKTLAEAKPQTTLSILEERDRFSRFKAVEALRDHGGHVKRAAQALGISWRLLYKWLAKWRIDPKKYREVGRPAARREEQAQ